MRLTMTYPLTLLLIFASCSGSSSKETVTPRDITKIGIVWPLVGNAPVQYMLPGTVLAQKEINAGPGILNHNLEFLQGNSVVNGDDGTSDDGALAATNSVLDAGAWAILGPLSGRQTKFVAPVTVPRHIPVFNTTTSSATITTLVDDGYNFRTISVGKLADQIGKYAINVDGRSRPLIMRSQVSDTSSKQDLSFVNNFDIALGEVVFYPTTSEFTYSTWDNLVAGVEGPRQTYANYGALLTYVFTNINPDAIYLMSNEQTPATELLQSQAGLGYSGGWYLDVSISASFFTGYPSVVDGMIGIVSGVRQGGPNWTRFFNDYKASLDLPIKDSSGYETNAGCVYDTIMIMALAATKAGSFTDLAQAIVDVTNPPGERINYGEYAKAVALLQAGTDIDYQGSECNGEGLDFNFDDKGDMAKSAYQIYQLLVNTDGTLRVQTVQEGTF